MDDHVVAARKDEDDGLEQARLSIEAEPQLAVRQVILVEGSTHIGQSAARTASCVRTPCLSALS